MSFRSLKLPWPYHQSIGFRWGHVWANWPWTWLPLADTFQVRPTFGRFLCFFSGGFLYIPHPWNWNYNLEIIVSKDGISSSLRFHFFRDFQFHECFWLFSRQSSSVVATGCFCWISMSTETATSFPRGSLWKRTLPNFRDILKMNETL